MRLRYVLGIITALALLSVIESSVLPAFLPAAGSRPNLVLIATSVWAALGAPYGLLWAFLGGLLADLNSAMPPGIYAFGIVLGNLAANVIEFAPIPVRWFRATTWTALVTAVAHSVLLAYVNSTGHSVDVVSSATSVVLPLLLLNPLAALPVFVALDRLTKRMFAGV